MSHDEEQIANPKNDASRCWTFYCEEGQQPTLGGLILFVLGFVGAWFGTDYVWLTWEMVGIPNTICVAGFHFHHLYIGVIISLVAAPLLFHYWRRPAGFLVFSMLLGAGLGLVVSDIIGHFVVINEVFSFWC